MIRITQIKLPIEHTEEDIQAAIIKQLKVPKSHILSYNISKKSVDARKKEIKYVYSIDVNIKEEKKLITNVSNISLISEEEYEFKAQGMEELIHRPVIVGSGPSGLFCALYLAELGYKPIIIERGEKVEDRIKSVNSFWEMGTLNLNSNVQFGEGGAGTFSDGKLNTQVKDVMGRNQFVLKTFTKVGAPEEILCWNKPHIGTDRLQKVIIKLRERIIEAGGEFHFSTSLTDINIKDNKITGIITNNKDEIDCSILILAIGHSARDTFELLYHKGIPMDKKPFAIGLRVEHSQDFINSSQYKTKDFSRLPVADYKLTHKSGNNRSVFSFCMCPGGFVVNASSEEGHLVVNGMSNYNRSEKNANSAIVVSVGVDDFLGDSPLSGIEFQRKLELKAYKYGNGKIPIQRYGDFLHNRESKALGSITPNLKGKYSFANLADCLPIYITEAIKDGMAAFEQKIPGFADEDVILSGVETRTSSPIRILRDEQFESIKIKGLYPCGEGAGYAGGIMSAAIDGLKTAEGITKRYRPGEEQKYSGKQNKFKGQK